MSARQPIDPAWWDTEHIDGVPIRHALAERDIKSIFQFLHRRGWSWGAIAQATDIGEQRVREIANGKRRIENYDVYLRIASGLNIPREYIGVGLAQPLATMSYPNPNSGQGLPSVPGPRLSGRSAPGECVSRMQSIDPVLVSHWLNLLKVLGESHNLFGPASLHDLVVREMSVIRQHRLAARSALAVNLLRVEAQWAEFASWTGDNLGDLESARLWLDHALALASESEDSQFVGYVLMRLAQQAADRQDAGEASSLADVARNKHEMSLRDQALCAVREAQGHALAADLATTNRKLSLAYELVSRADDADAEQSLVTFGKHCVSAYVQAHEGYCHLRLGRPQTAIRILEEALATWPASYPQDESLARAWLATAYAELGQIPEAAAEGTKAVDLGLRASSARTTRVLRQLDRRFSAHSMLAEVTAFHTAYITASGSARRS